MKKYLSVIMLTVICILGCSCRYAPPGDVSNVQITSVQSEIYSEEDINSAIDVIKDYFSRVCLGCTLQEIGYAGDDEYWLSRMQEWKIKYDADEVIILISKFYSDEPGEDTGMRPHLTYGNYQWRLARNEGGQWEHKDHGY